MCESVLFQTYILMIDMLLAKIENHLKICKTHVTASQSWGKHDSGISAGYINDGKCWIIYNSFH